MGDKGVMVGIGIRTDRVVRGNRGSGETRGSGDTGLRKFSGVVVGGLQVNTGPGA